MTFGSQVKALRTQKKLTQENLATQLNVSRQTISSWENNRNLPDLEMVVVIAKTFNISLDQLILGDDGMEQKLIKDGSSTRRARHYVVAGSLFFIGALCLVIKAFAGATLSPEGIVQEPFYLIPLGYLFVLIGLVYSLILFFRNRL